MSDKKIYLVTLYVQGAVTMRIRASTSIVANKSAQSLFSTAEIDSKGIVDISMECDASEVEIDDNQEMDKTVHDAVES